MIGVANHVAVPRHSVDSRLLGELLGRDFVPEVDHRVRFGTDKNNPGLLKLLSESRFLREKSVSGMNSLGTAVLARFNDSLDREIALRGDWRTNANCLIRHRYVQCIAICFRIDGDRAYTHRASRLDDAAGDLAPIGNQN